MLNPTLFSWLPLCLGVLIFLGGCDCAPEKAPSQKKTDRNEDAGPVEDAYTADVVEVLQLSVEPTTAEGYIEELLYFQAYLTNQDGMAVDITGDAVWSVVDTNIGEVKAPGVVLLKAAGTTQVQVEYGDDQASAALTSLAPEANVVSLAVQPSPLEVPQGLTTPVTAIAMYDNGQARDVTALATWESLHPDTFAVEQEDQGTLLRGVAQGQGTLRVSFASRQVEVPVEVLEAILVEIEIYPAAPSVPAGAHLEIFALGRFGDGELLDMTSAVSWTTEHGDIATISSQGHLRGVAQGTTTITATSGAITGTATATVTAAQILSLGVTPPVINIAAGSSVGLQATAVLSAESTINVTSETRWTVADPNIAMLTQEPGEGLRLKGIYPAATTLTAVYASQTTVVPVTVSDATLEFVELYPTQYQLAAGTMQPFYFVGTYSDGSRSNLTTTATWTSSDPAIAFVTETPPGQVTAVAPGTATISATYLDFTGSAQVTVTDAVVVSIQVYPPLITVPQGDDAQYDTYAIYSDNSQRYITHETTWSVVDDTIASISNAIGQSGLALGLAPGTTTISATYEHFVDTAQLNITQAQVDSILVFANPMVLTPGRGESADAWANYSNGTSLNVRAQAVWASSNEAIIQVSNSPGQRGRVTAISPGQADVIARFGDTEGSATVYVLAEPIDQVSIWPAQATLAPGLSEQLYLVGTYAQTPNVYEYLTAEAIWRTSDSSIATVGNYPTSPGRLFAHSPGPVTITATFGDLEATANYDVQNLSITALEISPANATLPMDALQQFIALATLSDNSTRDVTEDAVFSSQDNSVLTMLASASGWAMALAPGNTTISADMTDQTAQTAVTVIEATPTMVVLSPVNPIVTLYDQARFYATAIYSDNTTGDVTYLCSWSSSNSDVLLVLDDPSGKGYGWGMQTGTSTVSIDCFGLTDSTLATVR